MAKQELWDVAGEKMTFEEANAIRKEAYAVMHRQVVVVDGVTYDLSEATRVREGVVEKSHGGGSFYHNVYELPDQTFLSQMVPRSEVRDPGVETLYGMISHNALFKSRFFLTGDLSRATYERYDSQFEAEIRMRGGKK